MDYLVLLYQDPTTFTDDPAAREREFAAYTTYTEDMKKAGVYIDGAPVMATETTARCARVVGGKTEIMNGLAPDRKTVLVGWYRLTCADVDSAAAWGAKAPVATKGFVEIAQEMEM